MPEIRREETSGSSRGRDGENAQAALELALERADGSGGREFHRFQKPNIHVPGGGYCALYPRAYAASLGYCTNRVFCVSDDQTGAFRPSHHN